MKTVENKEFWEKENIISTQDQQETTSSDFEKYLFEKAKELLSITKIKIFGCGTGREVNEIAKIFPNAAIEATDISENMIASCNSNLKKWGVSNQVTTKVINAKDYVGVSNSVELVTIMNSMLTYVWKSEDRKQIFETCFSILKEKGVIIGVVHNQEGVFKKTAFFKLRKIVKPFLKNEVGFRYTGFSGFKVPGYYYDKKGLILQLREAGFQNIDVMSLEDFYNRRNKKYNRKTGYNNLIFIAQKL